jgi:hypothetical protein
MLSGIWGGERASRQRSRGSRLTLTVLLGFDSKTPETSSAESVNHSEGVPVLRFKGVVRTASTVSFAAAFLLDLLFRCSPTGLPRERRPPNKSDPRESESWLLPLP